MNSPSFQTVAEMTVRGRVYRYVLKHDDKGYYWDGMMYASWRRKTRASAEKFAARSCDIADIQVQ